MLCKCGCGVDAGTYKDTNGHGAVKGKPKTFIQGHNPAHVNTVEKFWSNVNKNGPIHPVLGTRCWLWTGRKTDYGYGTFGWGGRYEVTHRLAWFLTYGKYPEPCGLHSCDNPPCCNPEHIFEGTIADNNKDKALKGRSASPKGEVHYKTKLTASKVLLIRKLYAEGKTQGDIAKKFDIGRTTVNGIINFVNWRHVTK